MNFFNFLKKKEEKRAVGYGALQYNSFSSYNASQAMLLSTVYRCVNVISDSVAQLPCEPYKLDAIGNKQKYIDHCTYWLLNKEPNRQMTRFTFMKTMIMSMLLKGNAYAIIRRDTNGNAVELKYIDADFVTIQVTANRDIIYKIQGYDKEIESYNMIHLLNVSYDGIIGVSTIQDACKTLRLATASENSANGFFESGANVGGILKVNQLLNETQKQTLKQSWQSAFNATNGDPNGVAILEKGMEFQPIQINPVEAQLLETRKFNVIDICRFFGVSPVKAFDLEKSSYSTVEATQIAFLTDTLAPLLEKIELEFERKLYLPSEKKYIDVRFDTSVLLRADKTSLASYYSTLFNIGAISPNEIRKQLDMPAIPDGDKYFTQVNQAELKQFGE